MLEIKKLTKEEEKEAIYKSGRRIGAGSSRAVYEYPADEWGIKRVIKVAVSQHGILQNEQEVNTYTEYNEMGYFAHIYAYGELVLIMEYVEEFNQDDSTDKEREDWADFINEVEAFLDDSIDGGQGGRTQVGNLVLYDYGYSMHSSRDRQVGNMCDWCDEYNIKDYAYDILNGDCDLIQADEDFDNCVEHEGDCVCERCEQNEMNGFAPPTQEELDVEGIYDTAMDNPEVQALNDRHYREESIFLTEFRPAEGVPADDDCWQRFWTVQDLMIERQNREKEELINDILQR